MKTRQKKLTRREQEWFAHLRGAQTRQMPLAQYCRAQGLNVQSLYKLRHQLSARKGPRSTAAARKPKPAEKFIAVRVAPAAAATPAGAACRLHLKGWVIECASRPRGSRD